LWAGGPIPLDSNSKHESPSNETILFPFVGRKKKCHCCEQKQNQSHQKKKQSHQKKKIMVGGSLAGLQEHLKLARDYAVEGLYDTSTIFFDGALAQINKYSPLSVFNFV